MNHECRRKAFWKRLVQFVSQMVADSLTNNVRLESQKKQNHYFLFQCVIWPCKNAVQACNHPWHKCAVTDRVNVCCFSSESSFQTVNNMYWGQSMTKRMCFDNDKFIYCKKSVIILLCTWWTCWLLSSDFFFYKWMESSLNCLKFLIKVCLKSHFGTLSALMKNVMINVVSKLQATLNQAKFWSI